MKQQRPHMLTTIEAQYQARIDALSPQERVARSAAMFQWFREMIGRQIRRELAASGHAASDEETNLRIALRIYESEPAVATLFRRRLDDVSRRSVSPHPDEVR